MQKNKRKGAVERREESTPSGVKPTPAWFVWGACLAIVSAGLSVVFMWQPWYPYTHAAQQEKANLIKPTLSSQAAPSFDFYAKLPSQSIQPQVTQLDAQIKADPLSAATGQAQTTGYYLVLATVNSDELANKLVMDGLVAGAPTKVEVKPTADGQMYKVYVGPVATYAQAAAYQRNLQKNSIAAAITSAAP